MELDMWTQFPMMIYLKNRLRCFIHKNGYYCDTFSQWFAGGFRLQGQGKPGGTLVICVHGHPHPELSWIHGCSYRVGRGIGGGMANPYLDVVVSVVFPGAISFVGHSETA